MIDKAGRDPNETKFRDQQRDVNRQLRDQGVKRADLQDKQNREEYHRRRREENKLKEAEEKKRGRRRARNKRNDN